MSVMYSRAAWSFANYACGHSTPVRGGERHIAGPCTECARLEIAIHPYLDRWAIIDLRSPAPKRQQYPYTTFAAAEAALGQLRKAPKP